MSLAWKVLFLAGSGAAIAQQAPLILVEPTRNTRVALSGATVEYLVVVESADPNANAVVQVTSRLWQSAGSLVAPVSPTVTNAATLVSGRGLFEARATIPSVRSATEMWMRCQPERQTTAAMNLRMVALPEAPLFALARAATTNFVVATSDLPQRFSNWLDSRRIDNYTALEPDAATQKPLLWLVADRPAEQPAAVLRRIKQLARSGAPVIWFSSYQDFSATVPAVVHWHHLPDAPPVIRLPASWQTELENDLVVEYQFAEIVKAAIDPNSTARSLAAGDRE